MERLCRPAAGLYIVTIDILECDGWLSRPFAAHTDVRLIDEVVVGATDVSEGVVMIP